MIFDGPNRLIILEAADGDTVESADLYSRWKDWVLTGLGALYPEAFTTIGGEPLGGGLFAGTYFFLNTTGGWLIRPREATHDLVINGNLYPVGAGDAMFAPTLGTFRVFLRLQTSSLTQALEGSGGGGSAPTASQVAAAVWGTDLPGAYANPDAGYLLSLLGRLGSIVVRGQRPSTEIEMAYQQVADFNVTLPPDVVQLTWPPLTPGTPPTSYVLTKSTDSGRTFSALATLDHDMTDLAVFDQNRQVFFYTDVAGGSGNIYKIVAMYGATPNLPAFAIVSVFPPLCTVFGYAFSVDGSPMKAGERQVRLSYVGKPRIAVPLTAGVQAAVAAIVGGVTQATVNQHGVWQIRGIQGATVDILLGDGIPMRVNLPISEGPVNIADLGAVFVSNPDRHR